MYLIGVTGFSGFIGKSISEDSNFNKYLIKNIDLKIEGDLIKCLEYNCYAILHLIGKAHDLKKVSNFQDYYKINTELTKEIFDAFLASKAKVFITVSSVKAVADEVDGVLTEGVVPKPISHYGKSKLLAEQYILSKLIPADKRVYILRPCMVHGPGNKGNLNLLYNLVSKGLPWPLGSFVNFRSFLSIENFCFILKELIDRDDIPSGVYNVADDVPLSTNEVIKMIAESKGRKPRILNVSRSLIKVLACVGDILKLPLNSERVQKLTESYIVSNTKIKEALGKPLPVSSKEGLIKTFKSFSDNA